MDNGDLEQAMQTHAQSQQERNDAQRTLEAVRAREEASSQKSSSRQSQKNKLLAQLERVRRETMDCENQLKDLDQQTKEAREMAHNYEKGKFTHVNLVYYHDLFVYETHICCCCCSTCCRRESPNV